MEEDLKYLDNMVKEYKQFGDLDNPVYEDTDRIYNAIENIIKGYRNLEYKNKGLVDNSNKLIEVTNLYLNSVPKSKIKEILGKLNISDIEPWSTYKVNGQILFDLEKLLGE